MFTICSPPGLQNEERLVRSKGVALVLCDVCLTVLVHLFQNVFSVHPSHRLWLMQAKEGAAQSSACVLSRVTTRPRLLSKTFAIRKQLEQSNMPFL